jgi:benzoyl-CoA reductase/2-hydroxyglutaryl-CoA dehydratase subunit BcrC/BadD/HgdB
MKTVAYCQPFVPPEWIAAHGLQPRWLPNRAGDEPAHSVRRGVCAVAAALFDGFAKDSLPAAILLTTTCDQFRYTAALLQRANELPVFLLHVPRTWQTATVRAYYRDELGRLGRFLVRCGGSSPGNDALAQTILQYDRARAAIRARTGPMTARAYAEAIDGVRGHLTGAAAPEVAEANGARPAILEQVGFALALVGGPMSRSDYELLATVENAGGQFVLDATESGERTLPAAVDIERLQADPIEELVRIYFDGIADVFQRPNDRLYAWLRARLADRGVRGIVFRRHIWCDHWHGELPRIREEFGVPVLDWDGAGQDSRARAGITGRMEAFLEMLR